MAYRHKLQSSRFEFKYIVTERQAQSIRTFLRGFLVRDRHFTEDHPRGYPVNSLYMDTPDLKLYNQTVHGLKNRFKLRIRFYDDRPDTPAFLEIKKRETMVVKKEHAAITKQAAARIWRGELADSSCLLRGSDDSKGAVAMHNFTRLCHQIGARPAIYVCYKREAYVSANSDQVRVTFDRDLHGGAYARQQELALPKRPVRAKQITNVILELKFTDRFPTWMNQLVTHFDLERISVPKYVECIDAMHLKPSAFMGA